MTGRNKNCDKFASTNDSDAKCPNSQRFSKIADVILNQNTDFCQFRASVGKARISNRPTQKQMKSMTQKEKRDLLIKLAEKIREDDEYWSRWSEDYDKTKAEYERLVSETPNIEKLREKLDTLDQVYNQCSSSGNGLYCHFGQVAESYFRVRPKELESVVVASWGGSVPESLNLSADLRRKTTSPVMVSISPTLAPGEAGAALRQIAEWLETRGGTAFAEADSIAKRIGTPIEQSCNQDESQNTEDTW